MMIQIYLVRNSSQCHTSLLTASDTARIAAINSEVDYYIQWTLCQKSGAPLDSSVAEAFEYARNVFHPWIGGESKERCILKTSSDIIDRAIAEFPTSIGEGTGESLVVVLPLMEEIPVWIRENSVHVS